MGEVLECLKKSLEAGETIDIRADGKAGAGLVMTIQIFADSAAEAGVYEVTEWPLFSAARKGANVRGFMRVRKGPIHRTCQVERPQLAMLFTEKTGEELDFAAGMDEGVFIVNTPKSPEEIAKKFKLKGDVFTIDGNRLGMEFLKHPIPNISVLAVLQRAMGLVSDADMLNALKFICAKRRLPERIIESNLNCLKASWEQFQMASIKGETSWKHPLPVFEGYDNYPTGAQSKLRTSQNNKTAGYARAGRRLVFVDPGDKCTGCSLCIVGCPENIITYIPDARRGLKVTGADTNQFCKLCRECIEICPVELFQEKSYEEIEALQKEGIVQ